MGFFFNLRGPFGASPVSLKIKALISYFTPPTFWWTPTSTRRFASSSLSLFSLRVYFFIVDCYRALFSSSLSLLSFFIISISCWALRFYSFSVKGISAVEPRIPPFNVPMLFTCLSDPGPLPWDALSSESYPSIFLSICSWRCYDFFSSASSCLI